jgi:hypothetical protein
MGLGDSGRMRGVDKAYSEAYGRGESVHAYIGIDNHIFTLVISSQFPSFAIQSILALCSWHGWHAPSLLCRGQCQQEKNESFLVNIFTKHSGGRVTVGWICGCTFVFLYIVLGVPWWD